jgi:type II secretory pathway component PulK
VTRRDRASGTWCARRGRSGGFALVVVLFMVIILATVAASFSVRTSGMYRLSMSRATSWRLYYADSGAIEEAKATLWRQFVQGKGGSGIRVAPEPSESSAGGVDIRVVFEDESGKFPVNSFASSDAGKRKDLALVLARLFEHLSLPYSTSLAAGVQDFIDKDTDGTREAHAKNKEVFEISELLAVEGLTPQVLYASAREGLPAAAHVLSTWHTNSINVNSAEPVIFMALAPHLTAADAAAIIAARKETPFASMEDLAARANVSGEALAELGRWAGFSTDTLSLKAEARLGDFTRRIEAVVWLDSTAAHTLYLRDGWQE